MISVVVPVYNVKKYLNNCMNTILMQTYTDFEVILVDDGSTDGCSNLCDTYLQKDKRVRVIHQENKGLSGARNTGIAAAKGEYITFIDSDDYINQNMFKILWENIVEEDAQVSVCGFLNVYENKIPKDRIYKRDKKVYSNIEAVKKIIEHQEKNMIVAWGKLYKSELLKEICFPVERYHEDEFTTYKLLYMAQTIVVTTAPLYYYLQRNSSIMGTEYSIKRLDKLEGLKECIGYFKAKKERNLIVLAWYRYLFNIQIAYFRAYYEMKENKKVLHELAKEYDREYRISNLKKSNLIPWNKKCLLAFFLKEKKLYCALVKIYTRIKRNLSE